MSTDPLPRLLYLVADDWYFVSHRLPMARAAQATGWEVHVAARLRAHAGAIRAEGFQVHALEWRRGTVNPLRLAQMTLHTRRLYRHVDPQLVHQVGIQASLIGSLARIGQATPAISAVTGLGYAFVSNRWRERLIRRPLALAIRLLFNRRGNTVLVQNPDDRAELIRIGVQSGRVAVVPGSGVDISRFRPQPEPAAGAAEGTTVAYVGRLLHAKGLATIVGAHRLNRQRGQRVRLLIAGEADPASPDSISEDILEGYRAVAGVELLGRVEDVRTIWRQAHIAVLDSVREGLPLCLLEAAACGRPIVSSDVPGSRVVARDGLTALLVPQGDATAMADAITRLAADPALRARLGSAGRRLVAAELSAERIGQATAALYQRVAG